MIKYSSEKVISSKSEDYDNKNKNKVRIEHEHTYTQTQSDCNLSMPDEISIDMVFFIVNCCFELIYFQ